MARIRTIKPEAFASESLAAVSLTAERTFFGLLTQADDRGRFRDQPAVIAGLLWSLRPGHGPMGVEDDLIQLAAEDLICRYTGDDGKAYLHVVTWSQHQRINPESVNAIKAGSSVYRCAGIVWSSCRRSVGLLIQATSGSFGGSGGLRTNRSGCCW
jgi:hypothetical protein